MQKILSIIVPSYNMEKLLEKDLSSLVVSERLLQFIEVIVVNDGSKDKTIDIARRFEKQFPGVFHAVDKPNGNYGSCVNAGLKKAKGVFIKVLDADDSFVTVNFERMIELLLSSEKIGEKVDLFFFDWRYVDEKGAVTKQLSFDIPPNKLISISNIDDIKFFKDIQHHAIAYRTSFLKSHNYHQTEGVSYTDTEWIYKPLLYVKRIKYHPIVVYSYLFGRQDQSMSPAQKAKGFNSMLTVERSMYREYLESKGKVEFINEELFKNKFIGNIGYLYVNYLIFYPSDETKKLLKQFDDDLKKNCLEIYDAVGELTTEKPRIKYVKAFRKNSNGLMYKSIVLFYGIRKFIKKCLRRG